MVKITKDDIYGFDPAVAPCIVFIVLFGIFGLHQTYLMVRYRSWYWWPFALGIWFEVIGYSTRIPSSQDKSSVGLYAVQTCLVLLSPALFAASIYMTLGRLLVYLKAERASMVSVRWMTGFFVTGDVISFCMQGAGGGLQSSAKHRETGSNVTIGGLAVQLAFFGGFVITSAVADLRLQKAQYNPVTPGRFAWRWLLWGLYVASALILVRSIFRVIEYAQGYGGYLMTHEVFMYVFDAVLMFFVCSIFSLVHPSRVLIRNQTISLPIDSSGHEMATYDERQNGEKDSESTHSLHGLRQQ